MSSHTEFSLIQHYFKQLTSPCDDVLLGIGDDCALLKCPADHVLAVSIDTLVADVHFFADSDPENIGHKSLAVGLSDLAAMGAKPAWFTLALTLPEVNEDWLKGFSQGLAKLAKQHNIQLVGGDTTRGPLSISIQVHGFVDPTKALRRDGAQVGDLIYVSGSLGDAGAALQLQLQHWDATELDENDKEYLKQRLECPVAKVTLGQSLAGLASAAIDISDGLLADLGHILDKSSVGAILQLAQLPLSSAMTKINRRTAEQFGLNAGDDYELCFTVSPDNVKQVKSLLSGQCAQIGVINDESGSITCIDKNGEIIAIKGTGYDHFSN